MKASNHVRPCCQTSSTNMVRVLHHHRTIFSMSCPLKTLLLFLDDDAIWTSSMSPTSPERWRMRSPRAGMTTSDQWTLTMSVSGLETGSSRAADVSDPFRTHPHLGVTINTSTDRQLFECERNKTQLGCCGQLKRGKAARGPATVSSRPTSRQTDVRKQVRSQQV